MTDEEMAVNWIRSQGWSEENLPSDELLQMEQAYLAGLKAGKDMAEADLATVAYMQGAERHKPKWHKVADGDLPKTGVQVLSEQGALVIYRGNGFDWVEYSPNAYNIRLRKWEEPIAWCEIPQYTD